MQNCLSKLLANPVKTRSFQLVGIGFVSIQLVGNGSLCQLVGNGFGVSLVGNGVSLVGNSNGVSLVGNGV